MFVNKPGSDPPFSVSFWDVAEIFADPCQWVMVDPPVGPTVDELVSGSAGYHPDTSPQDRADMNEIVSSIQFG